MITYKVKVNGEDKNLNLPEKLKEISIDYLNAVTKDVKIEKNWALIALCITDRLSTILTPKKDTSCQGTAIFVKSNGDCVAAAGEKAIINATDIMYGTEVSSAANILAPSKIRAIASTNKELLSFANSTPVWLVTFKMVPLSAIHGSYAIISDDEFNTMLEAISPYYN